MYTKMARTYSGDFSINLGAINFKTLFQKAQAIVGKTKKVSTTAEKYLPAATPTAAPVSLPAEITTAQAVEAPMSEPPKTNWMLVGGAVVAGLLAFKFFGRKKK